MPGGSMKTKSFGRNLEKYHRDFKAEMILAAIEENSGHMIILAAVDWGKTVGLKYDRTRNEHDRIRMTNHNSYCNEINGLFLS